MSVVLYPQFCCRQDQPSGRQKRPAKKVALRAVLRTDITPTKPHPEGYVVEQPHLLLVA
jgi:hypothetical protein